MKIRTITYGINLNSNKDYYKIQKAAEFNHFAKNAFEEEGYEVQTVRIATNKWSDYIDTNIKSNIISEIQTIEKIALENNQNFLNIGYSDSPEHISIIPEINLNSEIISCSANMLDNDRKIDFANVNAIAKAIIKISQTTENGYGNFRFCATANCPPHIPFFPVSYHSGSSDAFAIGLECGDLAYKAFSQAQSIENAEKELKAVYEQELKALEIIANRIAKEKNIAFSGIDSSLAPSLDKEGSIAYSYEKLNLGKFGESGSLAISSIITKVLKSLNVKLCGYSGLMLPVCEDMGLAARANENAYNLSSLLSLSSVCGCGLDTVPVPGDISQEKIKAILLDVASLSQKLNKPLSARLFPIPNKKAGEFTEFNSPYLINCKVFNV